MLKQKSDIQSLCFPVFIHKVSHRTILSDRRLVGNAGTNSIKILRENIGDSVRDINDLFYIYLIISRRTLKNTCR